MRAATTLALACAAPVSSACSAGSEPVADGDAAPDSHSGPWPLPAICVGLLEAAPSTAAQIDGMELSEEWFNDPAEIAMPADVEAAQGQSHDAFPGLRCGWASDTGGYMVDVHPHVPFYTELRLTGSQTLIEVDGVGEAAVYRADAGSLTSHTDQILVFSTALGTKAEQDDQVAVHREITTASAQAG